MTIKEQVAEYNEDAILFDDLDDAIVGVGQQHGMNTVVVYDRSRCIEILRKKYEEEGYSETQSFLDAQEYFDFNIGCAYVGKNTPIFIEEIHEDEE